MGSGPFHGVAIAGQMAPWAAVTSLAQTPGSHIRHVVCGQLHGLAIARQHHTRIASIGCQQLFAPLRVLVQQRDCGRGTALGAAHAALPHASQEAPLGRQQLLVCLQWTAGRSSEHPLFIQYCMQGCWQHRLLTSHQWLSCAVCKG